MKIFAPNKVVARSRFWYFMKRNEQISHLKKSSGELLYIGELTEKDPSTVKNYGIWIRYNSRSGITNMYKEYRDTTLVGAVHQMLQEMASRHKARYQQIHIVKTSEIKDEDCQRAQTRQFLDDPENPDKVLRFPPILKRPKIEKKYKKRFSVTRPKLFAY
jgi:large subunit ribosomal protein L18Ae